MISSRLRGNLVGALAGLLFVFSWAPALRLGALSDDWEIYRSVVSGGPFGMWSAPPSTFFRPVVSAVAWMDSVVWGLGWSGWHLTNLIVHAGNAVLVAFLAARLGVRAPGWAGLAFALWGTQAESVAWIAGRTDLVATSCALVALHGFLARSGGGYLLGTLALLLGLGAKESVIALPLACAVLAPFGPPGAGARAASWALVVAGFWLARGLWLGGAWVGGYGVAVHLPAPGTAAVDFASLLWTVVFPNPDREPGGALGWAAVLVGTVATLALTVRLAPPPRRRLVAALWVGAALLLLPAVGLRVDFLTGEGQRLTYLARALAVVALVDATAGLDRLRHGVLAVVVAAQVLVLRVQLADWRAAAAEASRALATLAALPPDAPTPPLPDNVDGAYVFRNGAEAARAVLTGRPGPVADGPHPDGR